MRFLIIQTAFPGDVILATSVAEKLHQYFPDASIDFLLRKGNENILENNPTISEVITWDKSHHKFSGLLKIISVIRKKKYNTVINPHRFASSGLITALSGAPDKIGFNKNPFSFFFSKKFNHEIGNGKHEIERNHELIRHLTDDVPAKPKLYPAENDFANIRKILHHQLHSEIRNAYICVAPASVWFTKQFPMEKWIELINQLPASFFVYLIGSKTDVALCESIQSQVSPGRAQLTRNLAGHFTFLESAALMKGAVMNFVNDSAPLHIASAVNAPVTAIFCSTIPGFGFGPLSDQATIIETKLKLDCRPCGLHGYKVCPLGHFNCAWSIEVNELLGSLQ